MTLIPEKKEKIRKERERERTRVGGERKEGGGEGRRYRLKTIPPKNIYIGTDKCYNGFCVIVRNRRGGEIEGLLTYAADTH